MDHHLDQSCLAAVSWQLFHHINMYHPAPIEFGYIFLLLLSLIFPALIVLTAWYHTQIGFQISASV